MSKLVEKIDSNRADEIIEKRMPLGLFMVEEPGKFVGIDNTNGNAWTQDFETEKQCEQWLKDEHSWDCYKCGVIHSPTISIHIEFNDGSDFDEITDLEVDDDIEDYILEKIKDEGWDDEVKEYGYGLYCPYCLESLE